MEVECQTLIARPRRQVAAYMFDPSNDGRWTTGVVSCRPRQEGRLQPGFRVERTVQFGGKEFSYEYTVFAGEGDSFVEMTVDKPFPMWIRYQLDESPGGTSVKIHTTGAPKGFFRLAAPLMKGKVRKSISSDLAKLKAEVEAMPA